MRAVPVVCLLLLPMLFLAWWSHGRLEPLPATAPATTPSTAATPKTAASAAAPSSAAAPPSAEASERRAESAPSAVAELPGFAPPERIEIDYPGPWSDDLELEIVAPGGELPHQSPFQVRITNRTEQTLALWDDLCTPGHTNLAFLVEEPGREPRVVRKTPPRQPNWDASFPPKTIVLEPGATTVREVNLAGYPFAGGVWRNPPEPNGEHPLEITAVLHVPENALADEHDAWTGVARADPLTVRVVNPRLKTPHQYLWNHCPSRALEMLQADPTWVERRDEDQRTPLHVAARFGHLEVVEWLLAHGAAPSPGAYNEFTPLHLASKPAILDALIQGGADLDAVDVWGKTPMQKAAQEGSERKVDALLAAGDDIDLVTALFLEREEDVLRILAETPNAARGDKGHADLWGNSTPLGIAAGKGNVELVRRLLEAGADADARTFMPIGGGESSPLCNAVWGNHLDVARLLLERGAGCDVTGGKFHPTILDFAKAKGSPEMVALLQEHCEE